MTIVRFDSEWEMTYERLTLQACVSVAQNSILALRSLMLPVSNASIEFLII